MAACILRRRGAASRSAAAQATALRLTILEGLSLRKAAELQISAMSVSHREVRLAAQRAQKKALEALRQQLVGGG